MKILFLLILVFLFLKTSTYTSGTEACEPIVFSNQTVAGTICPQGVADTDMKYMGNNPYTSIQVILLNIPPSDVTDITCSMLINAMAYALNIPSMAITIYNIDRINYIPRTKFTLGILVPQLFNPSTGIYETSSAALSTYVDYAVQSLFTRYDNFVDVFNSKSTQQFYDCMNSDVFPGQSCSQVFSYMSTVDLKLDDVLVDILSNAPIDGTMAAGCRLRAALLKANFPASVIVYFGAI
jgi:hypothetical protein